MRLGETPSAALPVPRVSFVRGAQSQTPPLRCLRSCSGSPPMTETDGPDDNSVKLPSRSREGDALRSAVGQIVLVFQGGGALGAYQFGVYEALH
jgi:predicted acylesterase/phospholipase RssA